MLQSRLAIVDIETTGTSLSRDRIIEIGVVVLENGKIIEKYETFINPERYLPEMITGLTGISEKDLENAPSFYQIKDKLLELFEKAIFVAHNARFDKSFLKAEFLRLELNFEPKTLCTVRLSRKFYPQFKRHNLNEIIERFSFNCKRRHRALDDALVLVDFLQLVRKTFPYHEIEQNTKQLLGEAAIPPALAPEIIKNLPSTPGVYIFYDNNNFPLYVGKSLNLKERVQSHFSASLRETKEMKIFQNIHQIEAIPTCGELGALLLESSLIKKIQPLHNRRLRKTRRLIVLQKMTTPEGYDSVKTAHLEIINTPELGDIYGLFRSKKQAQDFLLEVAKEFMLCPKLLQLEKTKKYCFSYQLRRCKGACNQEESRFSYNLRLQEAFKKNKIRPWPYAGLIAIEEKNETGDQAEVFFINKWCLVGNGTLSEFGFQMKNNYQDNFDFDSYKIFARHLAKASTKKTVRNLTAEEFETLKQMS